jgi:hypothetical protein
MAVRKNLARGWTAEINTGTTGTPVWVDINGITAITPSMSTTDADNTTFDTAGWTDAFPASRSWNMTIDGKRLTDPDTGARDPGQEAVETAGFLIGPDSIRQYRVTEPATSGAVYTFEAATSVTPFGGGINDSTNWSVALTGVGAPTIS